MFQATASADLLAKGLFTLAPGITIWQGKVFIYNVYFITLFYFVRNIFSATLLFQYLV